MIDNATGLCLVCLVWIAVMAMCVVLGAVEWCINRFFNRGDS